MEAGQHLRDAAKSGNVAVLKELLNREPDNIDSQSTEGKSALHVAAENGKTEAVKLLIEHRANVNLRDTKGRPPLTLAAASGCTSVAEILLQNDAEVEPQDARGRSLLSFVVYLALNTGGTVPALPMVRLLLKYGANPRHEDKKRTTVLTVMDKVMAKLKVQWKYAQPLLVELASWNFVYRRAIVCCDGTWNDRETEQPFTNVTKLISCIASEANSRDARYEQIPYYIDGIGTGTTWMGSRTAAVSGEGITRKIREGYRHLCSTYRFEGDQIVLIGFSRGAYTIHCLAKFVSEVGLLGQAVVNKELPTIFEQWCQGQSAVAGGDSDLAKRCDELSRNGKLRRDVKIEVLAAWDMVKSLKTSLLSWNEPFPFVDGRLPPNVKKAYHALALDERRKHFQPVILSSNKKDQLKQCWFLGSHSDIGGGGDNGGLANVSLCWMISQISDAVEFSEEAIWDTTEDGSVLDIEAGEGIPDTNGNNSLGLLKIVNLTKSDSFTFFWRAFGSVLRQPGSRQGHTDGFKTYEKMHFSVQALPAIASAARTPSKSLALENFTYDNQGPRWIPKLKDGKTSTIREDMVCIYESNMLHRWMDRDLELAELFRRGEKASSQFLPPPDMDSMGWGRQASALNAEYQATDKTGQEGEEPDSDASEAA
ncbi:hypothetical protein Neosp_012166 [[Neocosmospora] mangrovei]